MTNATDTTGLSPGGIILLVLIGVVLLVSHGANQRRRARVCERHGHVLDPDTLGRWNESCRRCGTRLR